MSESTVQHTGRCLCGNVKYAFDGDPSWSVNCHCESCRRHTGAPMATFVGVPKSAFSFTHGAPKEHESSPATWRAFCSDCGTPLIYHAYWDQKCVHIYLGTLDNPGDFPPRLHVNFAEHVSWFDTADDLKRHLSMKKG